MFCDGQSAFPKFWMNCSVTLDVSLDNFQRLVASMKRDGLSVIFENLNVSFNLNLFLTAFFVKLG